MELSLAAMATITHSLGPSPHKTLKPLNLRACHFMKIRLYITSLLCACYAVHIERLVIIRLLSMARWQTRRLPARQLFARLPQGYPLAAPLAASELAQLSRRIQRLARFVPWRARCLEQALVFCWQLARRGQAYELVIGVKRGAQGPFMAHAWVCVAGQVWLGGPIDDYSELSRQTSHPAP